MPDDNIRLSPSSDDHSGNHTNSGDMPRNKLIHETEPLNTTNQVDVNYPESNFLVPPGMLASFIESDVNTDTLTVETEDSQNNIVDDDNLRSFDHSTNFAHSIAMDDTELIQSTDSNSLLSFSSDLYDLNTENVKVDKISKPIKFTPNRTTDNIKRPQLLLSNSNTKRPKHDNSSAKGPPKNSRFFKVYNVEGINNETSNLDCNLSNSTDSITVNDFSAIHKPHNNNSNNVKLNRNSLSSPASTNKNSKPSSIHHYNPYRYPQNRSKLNPHPDFIKNKKELFDPHNKSLNGLTVEESLDIPKYEESSLPELRPTLAELDDIYEYIESIREIGEKYGAVKVIPPKEFSPKFSINLESFWIKSSRQLWRSPAEELNSRCEFYKQLQTCLLSEGKNTINKLPCIDKRAIDLYRLYRVVHLRGGFQHCCNDKLWAQIGRELGFYGKISSSLSSSIKSVYQKYIKPWEMKFKDKKDQDFLNLSRNDRQYELVSKSELISAEKLPVILGSELSYQRNRRTLINAGFPSCYDQSTTQKKGITLNDLSTLPTYDFYSWNEPSSADDTVPTELKISSLYTLKQFYDKSRILKSQILNKFYESEHYKFENPYYLEHTFWDLLANEDAMFETEVSLNQSTCIHDSSYENKYLSEKNGIISESILGSLNFNNTSITDGSLLQYVDSKSDSLYHSNLNFCMFYGSQSWSMEDHWLYNIDYHYLGDAKSVYFIPPEYQEKYEELVKSKLDIKRQEYEKTNSIYKKFEGEMLFYDIFSACIENQVAYDMNLPRSKPNDLVFESFVDSDDLPIRFNNNMMFSPKYLKSQGIPVYHTFQEVGDMIIKFPKCYSSYFSLGTCVSESVNLATKDWLKESMNASKWLQKQQLLPRFSTFQMMLTIARESKERKILQELKPILEKLIDEELSKRNRLRGIIMDELNLNMDPSDLNEIDDLRQRILPVKKSSLNLENPAVFKSKKDTSNKVSLSTDNNLSIMPIEQDTVGAKLVTELGAWNLVTDVDLLDVFPTFISLKNPFNSNSTFTISGDEYLKRYKEPEFINKSFGCQLISVVDDKYLMDSLDILESKLITLDEWIEKFENLVGTFDKPSLESCLKLLKQGEVVFNKSNSHKNVVTNSNSYESSHYNRGLQFFKNLQAETKKVLEWEKKARCLFSYREEGFDRVLFPLEELRKIVGEINDFNIISNLFKDILNLAREIAEFDELATNALSKSQEELDFEELRGLHIIGSDLKVELTSFKILDKVVKRNSWIRTLNKGFNSLDDLRRIVEAGKGVEFDSESDYMHYKKLEASMKRGEELQREFHNFKESANSNNNKISYYKLVDLKEKCQDLPVNDIKVYIDMMISEYESVKDTVLPVVKLIKEKNETILSTTISFGEKITQFQNFIAKINELIFPEFIIINSRKLSRFVEFHEETEIFNLQLINGPKRINEEINKEFAGILNFGKDNEYSSMKNVDCLQYLKSYNKDLLASGDDRYCVCRQLHEGDMVECEKCKIWFHFNCIGYTEDINKYICPLCDHDEKYPTTKGFYNAVNAKYTFERFVEFSYEIMVNCSVLRDYELKFLEVTSQFWGFYNQILQDGIIDVRGNVISNDKVLIRRLLQKIGGCTIDYLGLHKALLKKHRQLCKPHPKSKAIKNSSYNNNAGFSDTLNRKDPGPLLNGAVPSVSYNKSLEVKHQRSITKQ